MKTGIELISEERREQIEKHGRTIERDAELNDCNQLPFAASYLIFPHLGSPGSPVHALSTPQDWEEKIWVKMASKPYKERLVIAGALLAAEIDRLQYLEKGMSTK